MKLNNLIVIFFNQFNKNGINIGFNNPIFLFFIRIYKTTRKLNKIKIYSQFYLYIIVSGFIYKKSRKNS